jgi:hypothetical protein
LLHLLTAESGTKRTCRDSLTMSVDRGKADLALGRSGGFLSEVFTTRAPLR